MCTPTRHSSVDVWCLAAETLIDHQFLLMLLPAGLPAWQNANISFTQWSNNGFFTPYGQHINVKLIVFCFLFVVALSPVFPQTLMVGMEIRVKVSDYVIDRITALRRQYPGMYQNIACIRTNAMKYLPNYFKKGQVLWSKENPVYRYHCCFAYYPNNTLSSIVLCCHVQCKFINALYQKCFSGHFVTGIVILVTLFGLCRLCGYSINFGIALYYYYSKLF